MKLFWVLLIAVSVFFGDFFLKSYVYSHFPLIQYAIPDYPYGGMGVFQDLLGIDFSINYQANKGAAWGMFSSLQDYLLYFRLLVIGALIVFVSFFNKIKGRLFPFVLIITGAVANVSDYYIYGHVVDMFYFKFGSYSYPIFNIADSAIFCGTIWLILQPYLAKNRPLA